MCEGHTFGVFDIKTVLIKGGFVTAEDAEEWADINLTIEYYIMEE